MKKYFQAPWTMKDLGLVAGSIIILAVIFIGVFYGLRLNIENKEFKSIYFYLFFALQWIIIFAPLLILTKRKYKLHFSQFGFLKIGFLKMLGLILTAYIIYWAINIIISLIVIYGNIKIPGYQIQESIFKLFGSDLTSIIISGVLIVLIAPIIEEIFFRGFLLRTLANKTGDIFGSILTALIFTFLHFPWQSIIPVFILGLILNSLVVKTKSIWPAIGFHILNNGLAFTILLLIEKGVLSLEKL